MSSCGEATQVRREDHSGLEALADDQLILMGEQEIQSAAVAELWLTEVGDRDIGELEAKDRQLRAMVTAWLNSLHREYLEVFARLWPDDGDIASEEFVTHVGDWLGSQRASDPENSVLSGPTSDDEAEDDWDWPWPSTEVTKALVSGRFDFNRERSALNLLGYRTGKGKGLADEERWTLLDQFYRRRLPWQIQHIYQDEYGAPATPDRLQKMANVLASNCRNMKKRTNVDSYGVAIGHYEADLDHLKSRYYRREWFEWPSTDV